ncbi:MAG: NADH/ubiquinone/plastoquinone (complex I) [Candidatus Omnitrophica bacterium]|nr:NADH/ubiquinone/plastoquinone (complex I) [Candidatus Omnitrophota bacterium]MCM8808741.1 NADH/ubiquinone/plastoquinone (complex I) [Candidatus Omnitrophota bacterium]MCM8810217.1 NADH/ubiquinone/plastoquinone (complex I) [Candidatus Omnitrophota bacterium]
MINLPLFVIIPFGVAFFIPMVSRKIKWVPDVLGNLTTFILLLLSLMTLNQEHVYHIGGWKPPFGIVLVLDGLSCLLLIIINLISFMATLFSIEYIEKRFTSKLRYYSLFLLMVGGMNGTVLSGDLFNLFVFMEIASIASYALVGFGCEASELEASFKYLVMGNVASLFVLYGVALLYGKTGSLNIADVARILKEIPSDNLVNFAFVLLIGGFMVKSALVPFHAWLPDAHPSAPAPISAMLSGVVIKALGVYVICRLIFNLFGFNHLISQTLIYLGVISMIVGVCLALLQSDLKRLLAYHSISQIGYVFVGIGIGTPLGILGGLFHLFNHSLFKSLLFLDSGSIEYQTGTRDLNKMGLLYKKMPITSFSTLFASLSISGIPPFNGFWSKLIIILAAIKSGKSIIALWAVIGSILTLSSFTKVLRYSIYGKGEKWEKEKWEKLKEVPDTMVVPLIILSLLCLFTGLLIIGGTEGIFASTIDVLEGSVLKYINKVLGS